MFEPSSPNATGETPVVPVVPVFTVAPVVPAATAAIPAARIATSTAFCQRRSGAGRSRQAISPTHTANDTISAFCVAVTHGENGNTSASCRNRKAAKDEIMANRTHVHTMSRLLSLRTLENSTPAPPSAAM